MRCFSIFLLVYQGGFGAHFSLFLLVVCLLLFILNGEVGRKSLKVDEKMGLFFEKSNVKPIKIFTILRFVFIFMLLLYLILGLQNTDLLLPGRLYLILALMFLMDAVESWMQKSKYLFRYLMLSLLFLFLLFIY